MVDSEVKTSLAFCDERNTCESCFSIWHKASKQSRLSHPRLLDAFPSVRVRQDKVNVVDNGIPKVDAVRMGFLDVGPRAGIKILEVVSKNIDGLFVGRKRRQFLCKIF